MFKRRQKWTEIPEYVAPNPDLSTSEVRNYGGTRANIMTVDGIVDGHLQTPEYPANYAGSTREHSERASLCAELQMGEDAVATVVAPIVEGQYVMPEMLYLDHVTVRGPGNLAVEQALGPIELECRSAEGDLCTKTDICVYVNDLPKRDLFIATGQIPIPVL